MFSKFYFGCIDKSYGKNNEWKSEYFGKDVYDLVAVVNHIGDNAKDSHYTAYVKVMDLKQEKWYEFDDACVTEIGIERVQSKAAYVLVYRKKEKVDYVYDV